MKGGLNIIMDVFSHIKPDAVHEAAAIDYINEFKEYGSRINGAGGLDRYLPDDYAGWLEKLAADRVRIPDEERVPAETFFLVRESDGRIIGMVNIRLALNDDLKKSGGNIGYAIRPTERRKGYNKVNLYLALLCLKKHGNKEALLDCDVENIASARTMQALGGQMIEEFYDKEEGCNSQKYIIDIDKAIEKYGPIYEQMICRL